MELISNFKKGKIVSKKVSDANIVNKLGSYQHGEDIRRIPIIKKKGNKKKQAHGKQGAHCNPSSQGYTQGSTIYLLIWESYSKELFSFITYHKRASLLFYINVFIHYHAIFA